MRLCREKNNMQATMTNSTCETCKLKENAFLCHLTEAAAKQFQSIKSTISYPAGVRLFLENEPARGIFLLCSGKIKLSVSSRGGKTLILHLAGPGEILGLSATISGLPHEVSAETLYPSQVAFIRREDFLSFVNLFPETYQAVIRQLNSQYAGACEQLRTVGLSNNANEKIARLFLNWSSDEAHASESTKIRVPLTHEQIAECVGSTRETVTRTLSQFKSKRLVMLNGTTAMIPSRAALMAISGD
jgi:CRP/FNR family transcriptional regulator, cyclic AMP receptor protein